jgi:hypothetical protein
VGGQHGKDKNWQSKPVVDSALTGVLMLHQLAVKGGVKSDY